MLKELFKKGWEKFYPESFDSLFTYFHSTGVKNFNTTEVLKNVKKMGHSFCEVIFKALFQQ